MNRRQKYVIKSKIYSLIMFITRPLTWTSDDKFHPDWWPRLKSRIRIGLSNYLWEWIWNNE